MAFDMVSSFCHGGKAGIRHHDMTSGDDIVIVHDRRILLDMAIIGLLGALATKQYYYCQIAMNRGLFS